MHQTLSKIIDDNDSNSIDSKSPGESLPLKNNKVVLSWTKLLIVDLRCSIESCIFVSPIISACLMHLNPSVNIDDNDNNSIDY